MPEPWVPTDGSVHLNSTVAGAGGAQLSSEHVRGTIDLVLRDRSNPERVELLVDLTEAEGETQVAAGFQRVFASGDTELQDIATAWLRSRMGETQIVNLLDPLASNADALVRRDALNQLARLGTARTLDVIAGSLNDPDAGVRRVAVNLIAIYNGNAANDRLRQALQDSDPSVALAAAVHLAERGDASGRPLLRKHENSPIDQLSTLSTHGLRKLSSVKGGHE